MSNMNEQYISPADVKAVFRVATEKNNKPAGLGRVFKSLRKPALDVGTLQHAWANDPAGAYSDDTADIKHILYDAGFAEKDIQSVFDQVLGKSSDDSEVSVEQNKAIKKIADHAKANGMAPALIAFLEREYKFTDVTEGKISIEEVREIFTRMIPMERTNMSSLIREEDKKHLGRTKK